MIILMLLLMPITAHVNPFIGPCAQGTQTNVKNLTMTSLKLPFGPRELPGWCKCAGSLLFDPLWIL